MEKITKPALTISITPSVLAFWASEEYGSWEDHRYSPSHVYSILTRRKTIIKAYTEQEIRALIASAEYWGNISFGGDEGLQKTREAIHRIALYLKSKSQDIQQPAIVTRTKIKKQVKCPDCGQILYRRKVGGEFEKVHLLRPGTKMEAITTCKGKVNGSEI